MDKIDRHISRIIQQNGRSSSAELAEAVGVSLSTANERVRRLSANGVVTAWRAVLDPLSVGAALCGFILVDMAFDGEKDAKEALARYPEIQEMHHVSGAHSYLLKVRVADTSAMQRFLQDVLKPMGAVQHTETFFVLETVKETTEVFIAEPSEKA